MFLYFKLLLSLDGTTEYGKVLRRLFLTGKISEKQFEILDNKNFEKWNKVTKWSYEDYLKFATV
jgi:hypothetical protein